MPRNRAILIAVALGGACAGQEWTGETRPQPAATVAPGACAHPGRDGIIGAGKHFFREPADFNEDGIPEVLVADRGLCTPADNCFWNIYAPDATGRCESHVYLGALAGDDFNSLGVHGERNYVNLRVVWHLSGTNFLAEDYVFRGNGYVMVDSRECRATGRGNVCRMK